MAGIVHIVTGLPGSGKTEVARIINDRLKALVVNTDDVRHKVFPSAHESSSGDFTRDQLDIVYRCLAALSYYLMKALPETHIVFDGSFRLESQRQRIIREVHSFGHEFRVWYVKTDSEVIKHRITVRHEVERHQADFNTYLGVLHEYEIPRNPWAIIDNSGTFSELRIKVDYHLQSLDVPPEKESGYNASLEAE